jgi:hypothetical protein
MSASPLGLNSKYVSGAAPGLKLEAERGHYSEPNQSPLRLTEDDRNGAESPTKVASPADVYFGRGQTILLERERIKRQTIDNRRLQHHAQAA